MWNSRAAPYSRPGAAPAVNRRRIETLVLGCIVASALTLSSARGAPALEQGALDFWQTCEAASAGSITDEDFELAAILANSARQIADKSDPQGWRPALSRYPLMLAYYELGKDDLGDRVERMKPFGWMDQGLGDFIETARTIGSSFSSQWRKHARDSGARDIEQKARQLGAESLLTFEVALRKQLRPQDEDRLAYAYALLGLAIARRDARESLKPFEDAYQHFKASARHRTALEEASRRFSFGTPGEAASADARSGLNSDGALALMGFGGNLIRDVEKSVAEKQSKDVLAPKIRLASDVLTEVDRALEGVRASWPTNPYLGYASRYWGRLYAAEFAATKTEPGRYPDSFAKAKDAYEKALLILEYSRGPNSDDVKDTAEDYVDVLRAAGRNDEAREIAKRYRVAY
jgi:hypothetical protein